MFQALVHWSIGLFYILVSRLDFIHCFLGIIGGDQLSWDLYWGIDQVAA